MSEAAGEAARGVPRAPRSPRSPKSIGPWERARARLARNRSFKLAFVLLWLLYGAAIHAPFLANDRPFVLHATDYGSYDAARRRLPLALSGLRSLLEKGETRYLSERVRGATQGYGDALRSEARGLWNAVDTMSLYLDEGRAEELSAFAREVDHVVGMGLADRRQEARHRVDQLREEAKGLRQAFRPAEGDDGGVSLVLHRSFPLFAALRPLEVFFMVAWSGATVLLLFRLRRRAHWLGLGGLVLVATVGVALATAGERASFYPDYKVGLSSGKIVAERVVFPPIAMGFAEIGTEALRPPTWHESAEIDEEGEYVSGWRKAVEEADAPMRPPSPVEVRFAEPARNDPWRHPFGTDGLGRDLLARAIHGGRVSLAVGLVSTLVLVLIGVSLGALAGYFGGLTDLLISRLIEVVICFPALFLILGLVVLIGPSLVAIMAVIGLIRWTGVARLTRAEFLRLRELEYVHAARALGLSTPRILFRHMLPNALGPILVAATFSVASGLLIESSLSFLGFGVAEPVPSWGGLVRSSLNSAYWWIHLFPGALIFVTVLCYNLIGDAVRDALDPKLD